MIDLLRGGARLVGDAVVGTTRVVEGVHAAVLRTVGVPAPGPPDRAGPLSARVYDAVRLVARGVGRGVDAALVRLAPLLDARDWSGAGRDAFVAALNGVLGDHLDASRNPLATPMTLRRDGRPLAASDADGARPRIVLLVHGLCMHDGQWRRRAADGRERDLGARLARALDATLVHVRYNSGLPIERNGRALAVLLESMQARWPVPLESIAIVGHSMGGLVARSACAHGERAAHAWRARVTDLVFLGTPHHGAPLERAGHMVDSLLGATPWSAPFARLGAVRSAGIVDLRHGDATALPHDIRCHAIAATLAAPGGSLAERALGDGLVPLRSALGADRVHGLAIPRARRHVAYRTGHFGLLESDEVAARVEAWLAHVR